MNTTTPNTPSETQTLVCSETATPTAIDTSLSVLANARDMDSAARACGALAKSKIVPEHLRGDTGSILACLDISQTLGCSVYMVMQNIYAVHGRMGFSGQFCISALNRCPQYKRIEYRYLNDRDCTDGMQVIGHRTDGYLDYGTPITPAMVKAEGWAKNSKWQTMADQMYRYRSAAFFVRAYCPEVLMGFQTADELRDLYANGTYKTEQPPAPAPAAPRNVTKKSAPIPATPIFTEETDELPLD